MSGTSSFVPQACVGGDGQVGAWSNDPHSVPPKNPHNAIMPSHRRRNRPVFIVSVLLFNTIFLTVSSMMNSLPLYTPQSTGEHNASPDEALVSSSPTRHALFGLSGNDSHAPQSSGEQNASPEEALVSSSPTRHVMFGLSGNDSGFMSEFKVSLKSVLLNAPLRNSLTVHVLADEDAYNSLGFLHHLRNWTAPTPIRIQTYNVDKYQAEWLQKIKARTSRAANMTKRSGLFRHTIGTYYRLFCSDVLPKSVESVLYMDTDVILLANIDVLWRQHADDSFSSFQWGKTKCAGFMKLRPSRMEQIWELFAQVPDATFQKLLRPRPAVDDQFILTAVDEAFPGTAGRLPPEFDISAQGGPWWNENPGLVLQHRPRAGMLHFNGGGISKNAFFESHRFMEDPNWRIARYYADLPWSWAQFITESQVRIGEGYKLSVEHKAKPMEERKAANLI